MPKNIKLNRADVEWLLATHENGQGPIDWHEESQRMRQGLDFRGANFRGENLSYLPLARMRGGRWAMTKEKRSAVAVHLEKANLEGANLQGAELWGAHLQEANLLEAYLLKARLEGAQLPVVC
mgnify:CR=1 FL=1